MHGFYHIFATHYSPLRRFVWSMFFLSSLTFFIGQSTRRISVFLDNPHSTILDEISNMELYFPSVTLCNMNEMRWSQITPRDFLNMGHFLGFVDENGQLFEPPFSKHDSMREVKKRLDYLMATALQYSKVSMNFPTNLAFF